MTIERDILPLTSTDEGENEEVQELIALFNENSKDGRKFEDLFRYDAKRGTWKLKKKYQLTERAINQRRAAARIPRKKREIAESSEYHELMDAALQMKKGLSCLIQKIRDLDKRGNGAPEIPKGE